MIRIDIGLIAIELIACVCLFLLAGIAEKLPNTKWKICYMIPVVVCIAFLAVQGIEVSMAGAYIGSVILLIGFFVEKKNIRRICSAVTVIPVIASLIIANNYPGYRASDYYHDFIVAVDSMEKFYVLEEHKNIDFDELRIKYGKKFREATENNDAVANYIAWQEFCSEFNDSHVCYSPSFDTDLIIEEAGKQVFGNDYGLGVKLLSDGRYAAVCVADSLKEMGINNGTIITAWDGKELSELGKDKVHYTSVQFADKENELFYQSLLGSGEGGDTVKIGYLDEGGNEQTAVLPKIGDYYSRLKIATEKIEGGAKVGHMTFNKVNDETYSLRIKSMMYDLQSMRNGNHDIMKEWVIGELQKLKEQGVKNIVIDMRSNGGGSGDMVIALGEIFAPVGEHYYSTDPEWDYDNKCYARDGTTGKFKEKSKTYFTGEGCWDGRIILLVNSGSVSAADHTVNIFGRLDNVTTMGFTKSAGSAQGIAAVYMDNGVFSYSASLMLDENCDIFIDAGEDMISHNDVEIKPEFDTEAVKAIFDGDRDYIMEKALEEFKR